MVVVQVFDLPLSVVDESFRQAAACAVGANMPAVLAGLDSSGAVLICISPACRSCAAIPGSAVAVPDVAEAELAANGVDAEGGAFLRMQEPESGRSVLLITGADWQEISG